MILRKAAISLAAATAIAGSSGIAMLGMSGVAGAAPLTTSGAQINAAVTLNPDPNTGDIPIAGTPYSAGQTIEVTVPANTVLSTTGAVKIIECSDPGGGTAGLPTSVADCDPAETIQGGAITPAADGSFTFKNYQVTNLPDSNLAPTSPITCGTSIDPCVLYIGDNYNNFSGAGYFLSQPFQVQDKDGNGDGADPGDGTPEVPLAVGLPLAAAGLFAGGLAIRRRRSNRANAA